MQNCKNADFTIKNPLGKGGFGLAYLAVHNTDQKEVCLKFIPQEKKTAAFNEAKTLSQLEDKHIIKYYGSFDEGDQFCIVMEYAPGASLYDEIEVWAVFLYCSNSVYLCSFYFQKRRLHGIEFREREIFDILYQISTGLLCLVSPYPYLLYCLLYFSVVYVF